VGWFASLAGTSADNVYRRTSSGWVNQNVPCGALDCPISEFGIQGQGADANILAAEGGLGATGTRTFRSTNGGSSWSSKNYDSTDAIVPLPASYAGIDVAADFSTSGTAFMSPTYINAAVMKSNNKGASWSDTGLSNRGLFAQGNSTPSDTTWFVRMRVGGANPAGSDTCPVGFPCEWYLTTNMGDSSAYVRVVRSNQPTDANDFEEADRSPTFASDGVMYLTRRGKGSNRIIKSTDGGHTWKSLTTNPTDTDQVTNVALVSASTIYVGTDVGNILWSTDGGNNWQTGTTDVGNRVLDIDFASDFATSNTMFVTAVSTSNTYEVWKSTDGGRTFTQLGTSTGAWGSGTAAVPSASLTLSPDYATSKMAFLTIRGAGDNDIWRIKTDDASAKWTGLGLVGADEEASTLNLFSTPGVGDGVELYFNADVDAAAGAGTTRHVARTFYPETINKTTYSKMVLASRTAFGDGTGGAAPTTAVSNWAQTGIRAHAQGRQWYWFPGSNPSAGQAPGRITNMLETTAFLTPPSISTPANNTSVPTNTGQNGVPTTLSWTNIDRVQSWDVQIALDADFNQTLVDSAVQGSAPGVVGTLCGAGGAALNGCVTTPSAVVSSTAAGATNQIIVAALVQGQSYFWRVRARTVLDCCLGAAPSGCVVHAGTVRCCQPGRTVVADAADSCGQRDSAEHGPDPTELEQSGWHGPVRDSGPPAEQRWPGHRPDHR